MDSLTNEERFVNIADGSSGSNQEWDESPIIWCKIFPLVTFHYPSAKE